MKIGLIGNGAIANYLRNAITRNNGSHLKFEIAAIVVRRERLSENPNLYVSTIDNLPNDIDLMIDCAGHSALKAYGCDILSKGIDLISVSLGALADQSFYDRLNDAAQKGKSKLHLASGAIGALDCLCAGNVGKLQSVTYIGRKPPIGWKGSPAETKIDLESLTSEAEIHFQGNARNAALAYPKNANVAAAVALAGIGFDETQVQLIADPIIESNIHEIRAIGDFGKFYFQIEGNSLPDNPRSSALAAMSIVSKLEQINQSIVI